MALFKTTGAKLTAFYVALFFLSSALLSIVSIFLVDGALRRQVDLRLTTEVQNLLAAPLLPDAITSHIGNERGIKYRLVDKNGQFLIGDLPAMGHVEGFFNAGLVENGVTESPDNLRALGRAVGDQFLVVAVDTDDVENVRDTLLGVFGLTALCAAILALFGGRWLSSFFMRRLDQLAGTAEAITKGDASRRMPLTKIDDEFDRLSLSLNTMLDRNAALLESQRQITNDIAHDLRTPLTRLRQKLEQRPNDDALADTDELLSTMNALLRIAEIEEGARKKYFSKTDLGEIVRTVAEAYAGAMEDQNKALTVGAEAASVIDGDKALLTQMLSNLIENIIAHTPRGTIAKITTSKSTSSVHLQVSDNGPGVSADETTKISRRFYRTERSRNTPGNGLGLSLVKAIAELHAAEMNIQNLAPGLGITFRFPAVQ
jgi:signal transduction histidine kinase